MKKLKIPRNTICSLPPKIAENPAGSVYLYMKT